MAKSKKVQSAKKERRDSISAVDFVKVYKPLAEAGKSAKEIGEAMSRDAEYVLVKAAQLRAVIAKQCEAANMSEDDKAKALAMVPGLRRGAGKSVLKMLGILE